VIEIRALANLDLLVLDGGEGTLPRRSIAVRAREGENEPVLGSGWVLAVGG
jgi:hypothetical protein